MRLPWRRLQPAGFGGKQRQLRMNQPPQAEACATGASEKFLVSLRMTKNMRILMQGTKARALFEIHENVDRVAAGIGAKQVAEVVVVNRQFSENVPAGFGQ